MTIKLRISDEKRAYIEDRRAMAEEALERKTEKFEKDQEELKAKLD